MKIAKSDLKVKISESLSFSDFSYELYNNQVLNDPHYDIYLGEWKIAHIAYASRNKLWYVSGLKTRFNSLDGAIRGILNRINS